MPEQARLARGGPTYPVERGRWSLVRALSGAHPEPMPQTSAKVQELTREECLALLPTVPVGRLVFTERALPAVVPVNFLLDRGRILVRTGTTSSLGAAVRGAVVAFQVDELDREARHGWSVTVTGRAYEVQDPLELIRIADLPLLPWVGGHLEHVIAVPVELVNGRRVGAGPWVAA